MARGNNDPLTKRGGGSTVGGSVAFVNRQPGPREKSGKNRLTEPLGGEGASNYGSGASGAHGAGKATDPHKS